MIYIRLNMLSIELGDDGGKRDIFIYCNQAGFLISPVFAFVLVNFFLTKQCNNYYYSILLEKYRLSICMYGVNTICLVFCILNIFSELSWVVQSFPLHQFFMFSRMWLASSFLFGERFTQVPFRA